ncbi:MAG: hypothetical protein ACKO5K_12260 [Armatimonadota bacterium]
MPSDQASLSAAVGRADANAGLPEPAGLITVHGPAGIGKTTWVERWAPSDTPFVRVCLRGVESVPAARAALFGAVGVPFPSDERMVWMLRQRPARLWFDHADEVAARQPVRFARWIAEIAAIPGGRVAVTTVAPLGVADELPVPVAPLRDGAERLLPGNVDPALATKWFHGHPTLLRLAAHSMAIEPGAVRAVVEDALGDPNGNLGALGRGLAGLAVRHLGYRLPEVPGLIHLAAHVPVGFEDAELASILSDACEEVVDAVLAAGLMKREAGRLVASVPLPGGNGSALYDLFLERWETHASIVLEGIYERFVESGSPESLAGFARNIGGWIRFGATCRNQEARRRIAAALPRLIAHLGCLEEAPAVSTALIEDLDGARALRNAGWHGVLRSDIALAQGDSTAARDALEPVLAAFQTVRDSRGTVAAHLADARLALLEGADDAAFRACAAALRLATEADDLAGQADALRMVGHVSRAKGDPVAVRDAFEYAAGLYEQIGDGRRDALCRGAQSEPLRAGGWHREAFECLVEATELLRAKSSFVEVAAAMIKAADLLGAAGDAERAVVVCESALEIARAQGDALGVVAALGVQRRAFVALALPEAAVAALIREREAVRAAGTDRNTAFDAALAEMDETLSKSPESARLRARWREDPEGVRTEGVDAVRCVLRLRSTTGLASDPSPLG